MADIRFGIFHKLNVACVGDGSMPMDVGIFTKVLVTPVMVSIASAPLWTLPQPIIAKLIIVSMMIGGELWACQTSILPSMTGVPGMPV